jgi:aryl-alcohol dehydrogenase-like predicted oxidoreductase
VAELKQALDIVKADVQVSAQDAIKVREGLATFSKLSNERMDRFHAVLQTEHDSLQNLYDNIKRDQESTTLEFNAIAIMMAELTKFVSLHDQLESLALGVDNLVM